MIDAKDTVTYPLSAIMDEDEESRIDQLERELAAAIASFSEERERAQREGARVIKLQGELAEAKRNYMDFDGGYAEGFSRYLERELADAVAKERERCARVCEERAKKYGEGDGYSPTKESACYECAYAIRKGE